MHYYCTQYSSYFLVRSGIFSLSLSQSKEREERKENFLLTLSLSFLKVIPRSGFPFFLIFTLLDVRSCRILFLFRKEEGASLHINFIHFNSLVSLYTTLLDPIHRWSEYKIEPVYENHKGRYSFHFSLFPFHIVLQFN